jgi:predicted homoserine dehydrogenase-like protein
VVATAKRDLRAGEVLDGEGGASVWGKLVPAATSVAIGGLPIGLANHVTLMRDVALGQCVTWDDVRTDTTNEAYRYRREMERTCHCEHSEAIPTQLCAPSVMGIAASLRSSQ